jgi:large subunit ribosomal protein L25
MGRMEMVVSKREPKGKGGARKLRSQGLIPAIFYGPKTKTTPVSCDGKDLFSVLERGGQNVLINLRIKVEGSGERTSNHVVMIRDLQVDPLKGLPIHADLYEVSMKEMMTVEVPIRLVGQAEGTKVGGILEQVRREIEIECLPADLPAHIEVDVSHLEIGDSVHVRDISVEKVKIMTDEQLTIATVVPPRVEKEVLPEAEAELEAEEAAEVPVEEEKETEDQE